MLFEFIFIYLLQQQKQQTIKLNEMIAKTGSIVPRNKPTNKLGFGIPL